MTDRIEPPITPGEVLQEDFLEPLGLSAYRLAKDIGVPINRVTLILRGERGITADTALRLSIYFGNSAQFWLNLQSHYDLEVARGGLSEIEAQVTGRAPSAA